MSWDVITECCRLPGRARAPRTPPPAEPVDLIETLAERLTEACLDEVPVQQAEITVHKPAAPIGLPFSDVSVTVRRSKAHQA